MSVVTPSRGAGRRGSSQGKFLKNSGPAASAGAKNGSTMGATRRIGSWAMASLHHPNADRVVVNVPDTVIFQDAAPRTWIFTSKRGEVMRKRQTEPSSILARFRAHTSCVLRYAPTETPHQVEVAELHELLKAVPSNLAAVQVPIQSKGGSATIFRNEYTLKNAERDVTFNTFQLMNWAQPENSSNKTGMPKLDPIIRCKNKSLSDTFDACTQRIVSFLEKTQKCKILRIIVEYMIDEDSIPWVLWIPETLTFDGAAAEDLLLSSLRSRSTRTKGWSNNELQEKAFDHLDETVHAQIARGTLRVANQRNPAATGENHPAEPAEDPDEFVRQLGNAAQHLRGRSERERSMDFRTRQELAASTSPALKHMHANQAGTDAAHARGHAGSKSSMPSPFRCMGDFCNFSIEDPDGLADTHVHSGHVQVGLDPAHRGGVLHGPPGTAPAHNPHGPGSMGLVTRILSTYEAQALQSSPNFFSDISHMLKSADEDKKMYSVTRKSIVVARQERRRGAKAPRSGGNDEPAHRFMRATHSRLRYEKHEATTGGSTVDGLTHAKYYERQNVCKSCFLVYTTLDRAREALKIQEARVAGGFPAVATGEELQRTGGDLQRPATYDGGSSTKRLLDAEESSKAAKAAAQPGGTGKVDDVINLENYLRGVKKKKKKKTRVKRHKEHAALSDLGDASKPRYVASILVVDAEDDAAAKAKQLLLSKGYDVDVVDDGHKALEMIEKRSFLNQRYDAILMGRNLPTLDGVETTRLIRKREAREKAKERRVPIIAYTSEARQTDLRLYMEVGMDGCVSKPVEKFALFNTMAAAVPRHNPTKEPSAKERQDAKVDSLTGGQPRRPDKELALIPSIRAQLPAPKSTEEKIKEAMEGVGGGGRRKGKKDGVEDDIRGVFQMDTDHKIPYCVVQARRKGVGASAPRNVALFHLVICQDIFDNMEMYQIFFRPLVRKYPGLRVLVYNMPGQAYTEFDSETLLNNRYYAHVLKSLLDYVDADGTKQFITTGVPFYLLGFGHGANIALTYAIEHGHPSMRGLISVNGHSYVGPHLAGAMHDCVNVFSCCPESRPDLPLYFYTRFIFSGDYLKKTSAPLALNLYSAVHNPITLKGRIQICKGVLANIDLRPRLEELTCPVLVVQGTDDALIHPIHVKPLAKMRGGEVQSIHSCLKGRKRSCVIWIKGGHELWQEQRKKMSSLLEQLATGYYETNDVPVAHMDTILGPTKEDLAVAVNLKEKAAGNRDLTVRDELDGPGEDDNGPMPTATFEDGFIDTVLGKLTDVQRQERKAAAKSQMKLMERQRILDQQAQYASEVSGKLQGAGAASPRKGRRRGGKGKGGSGAASIGSAASEGGISSDMKGTLDPEHPSFELREYTHYKGGPQNKVHPTDMPEVREYMSWRIARNKTRLSFLERAAICVQRSWRAYLARTLVQRMRVQRATLFVQRVWRGVLGRREGRERTLLKWAAELVQRNWRGSYGRKVFNRMRGELAAAIFVQRVWRGRLGQLIVQRLRRRRYVSATKLQKLYRARAGRARAFAQRRSRNAAITIQRIYRGKMGRRKATAERQKYMFSRAQSTGIEFGRQMLVEHKLHATKLRSEITLLLREKATEEASVEQLLYEVRQFEAGVEEMEREMGELSKIEVEAEDRLNEKQRVEIRENKARLDREFGEMLGKIADRKEQLKMHENTLQTIDRKRMKKEEQLRDLERKLVVLLEEQQTQLAAIQAKQAEIGTNYLGGGATTLAVNKDTPLRRGPNGEMIPVSTANGPGGGGGGGGYVGPTPVQKQEAANLMQSTEQLMKFGFMSMSLTYFSSLNMIKAMKSVGAMDTILATANNNMTTLSDPSTYRPAPKPGQLPGDDELNVAAWSVNDVGTWLETMSLGQYRECFADGSVDGSFLYDLNDDDLHNTLGIEHKLHRKKIINSIRRLKFAEEEQVRKKQAAEARRAGGGADVRGSFPPTEANALADAAAEARPGGLAPDESQLATAEAQREQDIMTLDPDQLFSWARHGKYGNITKTFDAFPNIRFDSGVIRRQYLEDYGTQYSDEYNLARHVNMVDAQGNTLFLVACQNGHAKIPKYLLEKGANPSHQNNQGQTALHYAMTYGFYELGSWLVDGVEGAGANDTLENKFGLGPYDGLTTD
eukprot:INCI4048.3.p1 GENE.INCI4048.3~~INCI4048.3.p1  ORF type:complete len:2134 (-),score=426.39 INCI4048.3:1814-8215(-)